MTKKNQTAIKKKWQRIVKYFSEELWQLDLSGLTRIKKTVFKSTQVLYLVVEGFVKDKLLLRASALTYWTLLAIVPLFAFMFSILKGLGVQKRLEPILLERVAAGSHAVVEQIINYIDRVNAGSLGAIGLAVLLLTVISMLSNIEATFNDIWGIRVQRSTIRKFSDYLSLLFIFPVVIFVVMSLTASVKSTAIITWMTQQPGLGHFIILLMKIIPYVMLWILFSFLFMFMPNTKVNLLPAISAGILTGTCWQIAQWGYVTFQIGVTKYNAIYGTFAQLPIMLIWIYISWVIVLFGSEFSFALQNVATYRREQESDVVNIESRMELALAFLRDIYRVYVNGEPLWQDTTLAARHQVSVRLARSVLTGMIEGRLIINVNNQQDSEVVPARDLGDLTLAEIIEQLEQTGPGLVDYQHRQSETVLRKKEKELIAQLKSFRRKTFKNLKLRDI